MDRIFIDATSTANTLHHTGIQRVVRSLILYGAVRAEDWIPVVWSEEGYRAPTRFERQRLVNVFAGGLHRKPWLSRFLERWEKKWYIDFLREPEDAVFLLPEIPSGSRLEFLDDLASTGARQIQMAAICHDLLSWSSPQWTAPSRKEGFMDYLKFLGLVERVICPSETTASEWKRFQKEEGVKGADPEIMPWPIIGEPIDRIDDQDGIPLVLCVGTLEARKNHMRLLEAAELLWSKGIRFELVLVGRLRARGENEIPERIKELANQGHPVSWKGSIDEDSLEELYRRSSFTVFPSLSEGYGLPVAESLARGRPCVCSNGGSVGEIARGGGCLMVDTTQSNQISDAIQSLLGHKDQLIALERESRNRIWPTWDRWMDLFNS